LVNSLPTSAWDISSTTSCNSQGYRLALACSIARATHPSRRLEVATHSQGLSAPILPFSFCTLENTLTKLLSTPLPTRSIPATNPPSSDSSTNMCILDPIPSLHPSLPLQSQCHIYPRYTPPTPPQTTQSTTGPPRRNRPIMHSAIIPPKRRQAPHITHCRTTPNSTPSTRSAWIKPTHEPGRSIDVARSGVQTMSCATRDLFCIRVPRARGLGWWFCFFRGIVHAILSDAGYTWYGAPWLLHTALEVV